VTVEERHRYQGMVAGALVLIVVGVFLGEKWVVALAGVPLGFVVFGALSGVPDPDITLAREIEPRRPIPADQVTVHLTIHNEGEASIPDLRLVDGVPDALSVTDGRSSLSTALVPGQSETITYTLQAKRGIHSFDQPQVRVRGSAADSYRDVAAPIDGDTEFAARIFLDNPPTVRETATLVGAVTSDTGGSGVEFHTVRKYRPGDPINRIEWRRFARDGELATVNYREYGGLSVLVVADCRPEADVVPGPGRAAGSDLCQYAADRIVHASTNAGHETGLGVLSSTSIPWISLEASNVHIRTRSALRSVADGEPWNGPEIDLKHITDGSTLAERVIKRLHPGTQVILITPLGDDVPVEFVRQLTNHGYRVSVLSPDIGVSETPGARLVRAERNTRLQQLRESGVETTNWRRTDPLPVTLARATAGRHS